MGDQTTSTRVRATAPVVRTFRHASGDDSPLHVDPDYARRTAFGEPVVHGVLGALLALAGLAPRRARSPYRIAARFQAPLHADQDYTRVVVEDVAARGVVRLCDAGRTLLEVTAEFHDTSTADTEVDTTARGLVRDRAREAELADFTVGQRLGDGYAPRWDGVARLVDDLKLAERGLGQVPVAVLGWLSYLVGMEAPGRSALLSDFEVTFQDARHDGPFTAEARVAEVQERFRLLRVSGTAEALGVRARASVRAFHRAKVPATDLATLDSLLPHGRPLAGRTALVVGASRGLGAALTQALALQGAEVYAGFHRSAADAADVVEQLGAAGARVHPVPGDAADPQWSVEVLERIRDERGGLDLLVLNACPTPSELPLAPATSRRSAEYVAHALALVREPLAALAGELSARGGQVMAVSSAWAVDPQRGWSAYVTAKSAVEGLLRTCAVEHPDASWFIARPPRLRTAMTASPLGGVRTAAVEPVAAALVRAAASTAEPGEVRVVSFDEEGLAVAEVGSEVGAGRPEPGPEGTDQPRIRSVSGEAADAEPHPSEEGAGGDGAGSEERRLDLALVATFTLDPLLEPLQHWCDRLGLGLRVTPADYAQVFQELLSPHGVFSTVRNGLKVVLVRTQDWPRGEARRVAEELGDAVRAHARHSPVPLLLMLCPPAPEHTAGRGRDTELLAAESLLSQALAGTSGVHVLGRERWSASLTPADVSYYDAARDRAAHIPLTQEGCAALAAGVARAAHTALTTPSKVIVLDCDNTLWGGVVGEDGPHGVRVESAHRAVQEWAVARQREGVLLCLASKNEDADVAEVLAVREDMPLRPEHLAARRVNWEPKALNIASLAAELDLGLDSFVFLDDNPVEVAAVRSAHPEVLSVRLPQDGEAVPGFLERLWSLDRLTVTEEDRRRTDLYLARGDREALRKEAASFADFVESLELVVDVAPPTPEQFPRASQLSYRTNQFNLSTVRRSEPELRELSTEPTANVRTVQVRDRFGDYGMVGLAVTRVDAEGASAELDTFLLSCRVLGRGVEHAFLASLAEELAEAGVSELVVPYVPSERNTPVRHFLASVFDEFGEDGEPGEDGRIVYRVPVSVAAEVRFQPQETPSQEERSEPAQPRPELTSGTGSESVRRRALLELAEDTDPLTTVLRATRPLARLTTPAGDTAGPSVPLSSAERLAEARERVCFAVCEVLGLPRADLGPQTSLESLRMSSLAMVDTTIRLEERYGQLPRTLFFEHRTLGDVAAALGGQMSGVPVADPDDAERDRLHEPAAPAVVVRRATAPTAATPPPSEVEESVAVVGLAGHYPGADSLEELWENVVHGRCATGPVPSERWDHSAVYSPEGGQGRTYSDIGAFLDGVADFDALYFGIAPRDAEQMDPQQRLFLQTAVEAVQDAGYDRHTLGRDVGVYVGAMADDYRTLSANSASSGRSPHPYADNYAIANRVSHFLDLTGPSLVVDTACSASGVALHLACEAVRRGTVTAAVAGGVNLVLHPVRHIQYAQMGMLSKTGACRPFAEGADGFVMGEGAGAVLLKPLSRALADGDHVYGLIRGTAVNSGGRASGFTVPSPEAQASLVSSALRDAGVDPLTVGYVEAHGSGTSLGDPIEVRALTRAFGEEAGAGGCALGSVKANIGHLEPAAGIAGLTKVLLQLKHRTLPPTPHSDTPNAFVEWDGGPFRLQRAAARWEPVGREPDGGTPPLRAGVSSFGAGGVNAHLVVEAYEKPPRADHAEGPARAELCVLSARTEEQLRCTARELADHLRGAGRSTSLADVAHTLRVGRAPLDVRGAFVAEGRLELLELLGRVAEGGVDGTPGVHTGRLTGGGQLTGLFEDLAGGQDFLSSLAAAGEWDALARLWVRGTELDWATLLPPARRVPLPTYPFERVPYWLPPVPVPPADRDEEGQVPNPEGARPTAEDVGAATVWVPRWEQADQHAHTAADRERSRPGTVLLLDSPEAAEVPATRQRGELPCPVVYAVEHTTGEPYDISTGPRVRPDNADDVRRLLEQAGAEGPVVLIDRRGLSTTGPSVDTAEHLSELLPTDLGRSVSVGGLPPLTYLQVTSAERRDPAEAAVAAFGRALARETSRYRHVRIELADGVAPSLDALVAEADSVDSEIRLGRDGRHVLRFTERTAAPDEGLPLTPGGHYLITGGCGGVGRLVANHLARRYGAQLTLLGRATPRPEHERFCGELSSLGGSAHYLQADVTDRQCLERALRSSRERFGRLDGVLHAAGLIEDALLRDKDDASLRRVLAPKTTGTALLDELTADDQLGVFVLFSSVVGTLGNAGQSDYAAANAYLDTFAVRRAHQVAEGRRQGRTVSVAWPLWAEGGMSLDAEAARTAVTAMGLVPIETPEALRVLELALRHGEPRQYVSCAEPAHIRTVFARAGLGAPPAEQPTATAGPDQPDEPDVDRVRALVLTCVAEVAGASADQLDVGTELGVYGFNSVLLATLANRLNDIFALALTPVTFYEFPTVEAITGHLLDQHGPRTAAALAGSTGSGGRADSSASATPPREAAPPSVPATPTRVGREPIAIVGLAGRFPGAPDAETFWQNLRAGQDLVTEVPAERWDWHAYDGDPSREPGTTNCRTGGFLESVTAFDAAHFALSPREASLMDPQQRLFLETCWHALEDAGYDPESLAGTRTGVFAGATLHDYLELLHKNGSEVTGHTVTGNVHAIVANRVSYLLDLRGPSETVDTACSSSLVALHRALAALRSGECETALVGGVNVVLTPTWYVSLGRGGMLSARGRCHTFDSRADGYVRAEGVGAVLLKPLGQALADGDTVRAVIRGSGVTHGGRAHSLTAPTPRGQADAIVAALHDAEVDPASVGYLESHGTGTRLGDPIEIQGLKQAFQRAARHDVPEGATVLGALKASVGHLESAAGVAGLISAVHALRDRVLPPVAGLGELNSYLQLNGSPFQVLREARPWQAQTSEPLRAGVSSFGFGGVNAHVVLEEPPPPALVEVETSPQVIVLSARTRDQLHVYAQRLRDFCATSDDIRCQDLAWTSQTGRTPMAERLGVVASSLSQLLARLDAYLDDTDAVGAAGVHVGGPHRSPAAGPARRPTDAADAAARWVAGERVEWSALHSGPRRRVPFPGYPFDHSTEFGPSLVPVSVPVAATAARTEPAAAAAAAAARQASGAASSVPPSASGGVGRAPSVWDADGTAPTLLTRDWVPAPRSTTATVESSAGRLSVLLVGTDDALTFAEATAHVSGTDKRGWVLVRQNSLLPRLGPDEYELDFGDHAAGQALAEHLSDIYGKVDAVVDLTDLSPHNGAADAAPLAQEAARVGLLQTLVRRATASGQELAVLHVSRGRVPLSHAAPRAAGATMAGLVRAVGAEYAAVRAASVDLDPATTAPQEVLATLREELDATSANPAEVCLRGTERYVPGPLRTLPSNAPRPELDPERTYLVSGGTAGLGLAAARRLVELGARKLALLGVRALPPRAQWQATAPSPSNASDQRLAELTRTLCDLETQGARIELHTGPLTDRGALRAFLARIHGELGPVAGVLHCAGSVDRGHPAFLRRTPDTIATTWEPKTDGLRALDELVAGDRPDFFVLYSSVCAVLPELAVGLSDYAAANAYLEAYAAERNAAEGPDGTRYLSVAWGSWAGVGMGEVTAPAYRAAGFGALTRDAGLALLEQVIAQRLETGVAAAVRPGSFPRSSETASTPGTPGSLRAVTGPHTRGADHGTTDTTALGAKEHQVTTSHDTSDATVKALVQEFLLDLMAEELLVARETVPSDTSFAELGVDSILIAGMVGRLEELTDAPLDPSVVLENPTVIRLANHLVERYPGAVERWAASQLPPSRATTSVVEDAPATPPRGNVLEPQPLAVIGMASRFPGAPSTEAYWRLLCEARSAIGEVPASRWNTGELYAPDQRPGRSLSRWGGFLAGVEDFDPEAFGISPDDASHVDPLIRLVLECAEETFRDAGYERSELAGTRTGVFAAAQTGAYAARIRTPHRNTVTGLNQNFAAAHLAQVYDLRGPHFVVDTACSSALAALSMAQQSLRLGECDTALVAAADLLLDEMPYLKLSASGALSPGGECRVFDARADGLVLGEGAGALLLKPLEAALADGDRVYAVLESVAVNNDGRTMGLTTPNPDAQEEVVRRAQRQAGVGPADIGYVEAHGTGTMIGDPMELRALTRAFTDDDGRTGYCAVGSVKSNIGHTLMAAGMAGLHKVVLSLRHQKIPPTLHCETPNPRFNFAQSPFYPNTSLRDFTPTGGIRRAGVSAFGFGGVNCHAILREPSAAELASRPAERAPLPPATFRRTRHWVEREPLVPATADNTSSASPSPTAAPVLPLPVATPAVAGLILPLEELS